MLREGQNTNRPLGLLSDNQRRVRGHRGRSFTNRCVSTVVSLGNCDAEVLGRACAEHRCPTSAWRKGDSLKFIRCPGGDDGSLAVAEPCGRPTTCNGKGLRARSSVRSRGDLLDHFGMSCLISVCGRGSLRQLTLPHVAGRYTG